MCNSMVDEYCKTIRRYGANISTEQLKISFDAFVSKFEKLDHPDMKYILIKQIIFPLTNLPHRNKKLTEPEIITHEFFVILRDNVIVDYFHRRQTEDIAIQKELLLNVCRLFMNICYHINDNNIDNIRHLFFHRPLIDELAKCLNDIGTYGQHLNDSLLLRSTSFLLSSFKHFRRSQIINDEYSLITPILVGVIQCLCSSYAVNMIKCLEQNFIQKINDGQMLFLDTMPLYLQWYSSEYRDPENFIKILRILLSEFTKWLTNCPPDSYLQCSYKLGTIIRHLSCFLVRPIESDNLNMLNEEFDPDYCELVSYWTLILSSILTYSNKKINVKLTTRIIIQNLYNFTLHSNVLNFMKTIPNLISMLLRMTDAEDVEIQLHTYRCLGKIMTETDIKTMANPDKIVGVYIEYIINTIDDPKNVERFFSLLESLKNFVQHDQVKIELIKQKALPLLFKCVLESRFDPIKVQLIVLEILFALSFNNDACLILKQNQEFINHIQILASKNNPNQSGLQRAAEGLFWRLEKEEEAIAKSIILNTYKYDIMISYSHKNDQICLQIHEQLVKDGFRVWIDRDCLRGSTMIGMANGIENSEYVLICMSNTYKQSVYCQSEAHYAFERGCRLIPIIIESNYKPDGWLGIIVSGKIYVNFAEVEFKLAYQKLKNEINEQRHQLLIKPKEKDQINTNSINTNQIQSTSESIIDLPDCITQWTCDHVRSFFLRRRLENTMLLLCTHMDGHHLLQLYEICLINRESMYQSLKLELNEKYHTLLPIADYINFLLEIKFFVPFNSEQSSRLSLKFCNIIYKYPNRLKAKDFYKASYSLKFARFH